jgi:hypothetical protein
MFLPSLLRQSDGTNGFSCDPNGPLSSLKLTYNGLSGTDGNLLTSIPSELLPMPYVLPPQRYDYASDVPWTSFTEQVGIDSHGRNYGDSVKVITGMSAADKRARQKR